jgi:hypothetical protein
MVHNIAVKTRLIPYVQLTPAVLVFVFDQLKVINDSLNKMFQKAVLFLVRLKCTWILASATCGGDSANKNTFSEITSIDWFVSFNS